MVIVHISHQRAERIAVEESNRKPCSIGCQTENVERTVGIQLQFLTGKSLCQFIQGGMQVIVRQGVRQAIAEKGQPRELTVLGFRSLRPAHDRGVPNAMDILPIRKQIV